MRVSVNNRSIASPRVTVALALYNGGRFVAEAVNSILRQDFRDFELLIVDDGSTDDSLALAESLAARDPRIRVLRSVHGGIARTTNRALEEARGVYFAPMDQDDVALPARLSRLTAYLDDHADVVVVSAGVTIIDAAGEAEARIPQRIPPADAAAALRFRCALVHPASMMRTQVVRALGGYRPVFAFAHDYDLFLRLAEVGRVANIPDRVLLKRRHPRQVTASRADRADQVVAGAVAYMSRLARRERMPDFVNGSEPLREAGARFIVEYLARHRELGPDVVHHFSRFLRHAPLQRDGRHEPAAVYLRYLAAAARVGGSRELVRSAYYLASFRVSEWAPRRASRAAASLNAA